MYNIDLQDRLRRLDGYLRDDGPSSPDPRERLAIGRAEATLILKAMNAGDLRDEPEHAGEVAADVLARLSRRFAPLRRPA